MAELKDVGDRLSIFTSRFPHEAHVWTLLKLVFLKLYIENVYTPIISKYYRKMFYVDLFAGTGVNKYKAGNKEVFLPGSPIIAWSYARYSFDKLFLVEYNEEYAESLSNLMRIIAPESKYSIIPDKAEKAYEEILEEISQHERSHFLCFIDPTGYSGVTWRMLKDLIGYKVRGDFIILLQVGYMAMHIGKHGKSEALTRFFGNDNWFNEIMELKKKTRNLRYAIIEYFCSRIKKIKGRERIIESISIKKNAKEEHYYLIFITNKTNSGNPWMKKVYELKNLVENHPEQVETAIGEILGIVKPIDKF